MSLLVCYGATRRNNVAPRSSRTKGRNAKMPAKKNLAPKTFVLNPAGNGEVELARSIKMGHVSAWTSVRAVHNESMLPIKEIREQLHAVHVLGERVTLVTKSNQVYFGNKDGFRSAQPLASKVVNICMGWKYTTFLMENKQAITYFDDQVLSTSKPWNATKIICSRDFAYYFDSRNPRQRFVQQINVDQVQEVDGNLMDSRVFANRGDYVFNQVGDNMMYLQLKSPNPKLNEPHSWRSFPRIQFADYLANEGVFMSKNRNFFIGQSLNGNLYYWDQQEHKHPMFTMIGRHQSLTVADMFVLKNHHVHLGDAVMAVEAKSPNESLASMEPNFWARVVDRSLLKGSEGILRQNVSASTSLEDEDYIRPVIDTTLPALFTLGHLFNNPDSFDVTFVLANNRAIYAHRVLLSLGSDLMARHFRGKWSGQSVVRLNSNNYAALKNYLHMVYFGQVESPMDRADMAAIERVFG